MLDRTQQILLGLVKEIDDLCRKNDIHYSIGGGTTIGAIRHGGFIPWDDDIDLYMTRDNWEKFIAIYQDGQFAENRVLESCEIDPGYSNTFGRYVATDNAAVHSHQITKDDPAGYVIDIFVFDPIMKKDMNKFLENYMLECDLINTMMGYSTRFDMNITRYKEYLRRKEREGLLPIVKELTDKIRDLGKDGHDSYAMEWGSAPMLMPASIFDQGYTRIPFEDIEVETVKAFSEYLTFQFGDEWVYMPLAEGIEGHEAIYSEEISYETIREDFRSCLDMAGLNKALLSRKMKLLKANPVRHKLQDHEAAIAAAKAKLELAKIIEENDIDVEALYEAKDFRQLAKVFASYYDAQLSPEMIGRLDRHSKQYRFFKPKCIMLDAPLMKIAVETLIRNERMAKAARLLEVYEACGGADEDVTSLGEEIRGVRDLVNRYSLVRKNTIDSFIKDVNAFLEKYPANSQIKRMKIRLVFDTLAYREGEESYDLIMSIAEELESEFPQGTLVHGEISKYKADAELLIHGDTQKAKELYEYAYAHTTNGIIRHEIDAIAEGLGLELDESDAPWKELEDKEPYTANVSRERAEAAAAKEGALTSGLTMLKVKRRWYNRVIEKDDAVKDHALDVFARTADRVALLAQYEDKIDDLLALEEAGDKEKLAEELAAHREAVERNYDKGLGLMVHPVLSRLQYEIYRDEGKGAYADAVDKLVPPQHRKPVGEK